MALNRIYCTVDEQPDGMRIYAWADHRVVGAADCCYDGAGVGVNLVYVSPGWRGQGIARMLLAFVEQINCLLAASPRS